MVENLAYDTEGLFEEVKNRARDAGSYSKEEWDDLVEEIVNEHLNIGEFDEDEDLSELIEVLKSRFTEFNPPEEGQV